MPSAPARKDLPALRLPESLETLASTSARQRDRLEAFRVVGLGQLAGFEIPEQALTRPRLLLPLALPPSPLACGTGNTAIPWLERRDWRIVRPVLGAQQVEPMPGSSAVGREHRARTAAVSAVAASRSSYAGMKLRMRRS